MTSKNVFSTPTFIVLYTMCTLNDIENHHIFTPSNMQPSNNYTADQYYSYMYLLTYMIKLAYTAKRNRDSHLQQELARALPLQIQNSC